MKHNVYVAHRILCAFYCAFLRLARIYPEVEPPFKELAALLSLLIEEDDDDHAAALILGECFGRFLSTMQSYEDQVVGVHELGSNESYAQYCLVMDKLDDALDRQLRNVRDNVRTILCVSGISLVLASTLRRRELQERLHDRRRRRRWLRSAAGIEYQRKLRYLRSHNHIVDPRKSRTAKRAADLYDE